VRASVGAQALATDRDIGSHLRAAWPWRRPRVWRGVAVSAKLAGVVMAGPSMDSERLAAGTGSEPPRGERDEGQLSAASLAATLTQLESAPLGPLGPMPTPGPRIGRFTILERIGAGSMGVVYTAYDDVLDRKIAVKVLRDGGPAASLRLLREAQAMARVAHPNVVTVHEVGTADDQVYVAMEFIRGVTLQVWQSGPGRGWREIVEAYIQAGRGLAAAHAAGLIHRDVKASNMMIGDDGRVRVLDFGLVRALEGALSDGSDGSGGPDGSGSGLQTGLRLTHAGDVLGTPAYMSPEQIRGAAVGPESDQFSLCVALYEALHGELPFAGDSLAALYRSIQRRRLPDPPRASRVPNWLRQVLLRGLHPAPELRYPTMDALVRALGASSVRRRRLWIAVGAAAAVSAALAGFLAARSQGPGLCSGAEAQLADVWGPGQRARVERALAVAGPQLAEELRPRVAASLARYSDAWKRAHEDACLAHARGEQSGVLLDRRMACLEQRKAGLREAVGVLAEADAEVVREALRVVHDLPPIARCNDVEALAAAVSPPADPAVAAEVARLRTLLARGEALAHAGRIAEAVQLGDEVVQAAGGVDYRPLAAEALLMRAKVGLKLAVDPRDRERLRQAMLAGIGSGTDEVAAEAAALQVFVRGQFSDTMASALDEVALAEELARRLPRPEPILGLLENNVGTVHMGRGEVPQARAAFERALARRERALAPDDVELAYTLANLAVVEDRPAEREGLLRRALEIFTAALGPSHLQTLDLRIVAGRHILDPVAALELVAPACDALERLHDGDLQRRSGCLASLGHLASEAGREREAAEHWAQAEQVAARSAAPLPREQVLFAGHAALRRHGPPDPAIVERLRGVLVAMEGEQLWWVRRDRAELQLVLALNLERLGRDDEAIAALSVAIADFVAAADLGRDVFGQQGLALARLRLAGLFTKTGRDEAEISPLISAAVEWYRAGGDVYNWRIRSAP
jgi:tetratricopeptide (TPR) repeat protein/predicted Ser/Thr protein kinase